MDFLGDLTTQPDEAHYLAAPAYSRVPNTLNAYESLGISQLRWFPDKIGNLNPHPGTDPLRWLSTAFNLDVYGATVRAYFDDPGGWRTDWGDGTYVSGDEWLSIGGWFLPYPWNNISQQNYISLVQERLTTTPWLVADFSNNAASVAIVRQPDITRTQFGPIVARPRPVVETYIPPSIPDRPTNLTIQPGNSSLTLAWTIPTSDGGSPLTSYRITEVNEGWTVNTGSANDVNPFTLTNLTNGHAQTFTVAAINAVGASPESDPVTATPVAPPPPTIPSAPTSVVGVSGDGLVHLSWSPPASNGGGAITSYRITPYISNVAQTPVNTGSSSGSHNVTGLVNGTEYTFAVAATNIAGTGPNSTPSSPVTPVEVLLSIPRPTQRTILSRNRPVEASGDTSAALLVDDSTATAWRSYPVFPQDTPARLAIDMRAYTSELASCTIVLKNNTRPSWNRSGGLGVNGVGQSKVRNYTIQKHASTSASAPAINDGGWTTVVTVTDNRWSDKFHRSVNLSGAGWVQVRVTDSTGASDNRDVGFTSVEISNDTDAEFLILGNSHSQEAFSGRNVDGGFYSAVGPIDVAIEAAIGEQVPAILVSAEGGYDIGTYWPEFSSHWAEYPTKYTIIMAGPNDANGWNINLNSLSPAGVNSAPAQTWKSHLQDMINGRASVGRKVILAKSPAAHNAAWTRPNLLIINQMIDELISENPGNVFAGPNCFTFFDNHPELFRAAGAGDTDLHPTYDQAGPIYSPSHPWTTGDPRGRYDNEVGSGPLTGYQWLIKIWADWFASEVYS